MPDLDVDCLRRTDGTAGGDVTARATLGEHLVKRLVPDARVQLALSER